uniref:Uncharacterized protein n=1 Tax=Strongyloides venezuelensis TaxID=75913 RepID=A0A0K0FKX4_STRVS
MLQQLNRRFLITASAISVGAYLCYVIRKFYFYSQNKSSNTGNDLFNNNELSYNLMDSSDVSTASLPFNNLEICNHEIEDQKGTLFLSNASIHTTPLQNDGNLFSLSTTQYHSIYDGDNKNEYSSDKDSICSNTSCGTAVGFRTPFSNFNDQ